ncbi:S-adenosyl-L-methionine-dependent methyltransferase [Alternaria rosae]|uniref:S-adenosyl-L-methionine-dependent methyltransferase n=1 Tax=Alternaria rosae TaxID=1187941 RepID=UPI001E8DF4DF|nr:S-adenosyl-L-methionine-dependent methyltransferase [Alternaria rosae]KAH6882923.1 S-adenosyl-L-methionine-dependent methyltransferase [Alternaria rosae]
MASFLDAEAAQKYKNAEKATRPYVKTIVQQSGIAAYLESGAEASILDFACGTGVVAQEIYDTVPKEKWGQLKVLGTDISPPMLEYLRARGETQGWMGLDTKTVDGNTDLTQVLPKASFTHIFVSFAIFMLPASTLTHLYSLLRPGGYMAVATWSSMSWDNLLTRSVALMNAPQPYSPSREELREKFCGRWADGSYLTQQFEAAGLGRVGTSNQKEAVRVGTPDVFVGSMQFPLHYVRSTWWQGQREGLMEELNGAMRGIVQQEVGEDGEVELGFDGVVGWGWKSG